MALLNARRLRFIADILHFDELERLRTKSTSWLHWLTFDGVMYSHAFVKCSPHFVISCLSYLLIYGRRM